MVRGFFVAVCLSFSRNSPWAAPWGSLVSKSCHICDLKGQCRNKMVSSRGITAESYLWPPRASELPRTGRTRIADNVCQCFSSLSLDTHICAYMYTHTACTHMYTLIYFVQTVRRLCHFLKFILHSFQIELLKNKI